MKHKPIYSLMKCDLKLNFILFSHRNKQRTLSAQFGFTIQSWQARHQRQRHSVCCTEWESASFPAGAMGLTGCREILDPSEISAPPPLAMWKIWLLIMSLFPIVLSLLHVRIHPSQAELIKELEMMLQLSEIAERLSESLAIWSAAGNHPPLTLSEAFLGLFCCFQVGFLAYCCLCSPGLLVSGWELF